MADITSIIGAFTEQQVERLTGVSQRQLRYWDRTGFYAPEHGSADRRLPFARIYSFRDLVALRTLNMLRNQFMVPLQHLRKVADQLKHLAGNLWTGTTLYVVNRRVAVHEPGTERPREVLSGQYLLPIELQQIVNATAHDTRDLRRDPETVGQVARHRSVARNAEVVAGTRIPVATIRHFLQDGYAVADILREYPSLTESDVLAIRDLHEAGRAA